MRKFLLRAIFFVSACRGPSGKPFPPGDVTARSMLCGLPSQSFVGITIDMRRALASFTSSPVLMRYKFAIRTGSTARTCPEKC
jgi:hypothetical protein